VRRAESAGMERLQAFHHVALTVRHLDTSVAWYRDVLGFEEAFREDGDERKASVMRFRSGGYSVGLVEHVRSGSDGFDPTRVGLDHLAFVVSSLDELERWVEHLTSAGVVHSGIVEVPPGAIVNLSDPDGTALALFWDRD
jgi:glyoxylase I family protein